MTTRERAHIHVHIHCTFLCNTTSTGILYVTTNSMCYPRHHRCVYTCETLHSTYHKLISSNSPLLVVFSIIYAHTYIHIYIIETAKHGSRSTACAYPILYILYYKYSDWQSESTSSLSAISSGVHSYSASGGSQR
jgi:hypothetical protein